MKVLVIGSTSFLLQHYDLTLLNRGDEIVELDNHNDYCYPVLKEVRLART